MAKKSEVSQVSPVQTALDFLKKEFPFGFRVNQAGEMVVARESVKITDLKQLSEIARATKQFQFPVNGRLVDLKVQGLSGEEDAAADKIARQCGVPPRKFKIEKGEKVWLDAYDYDEPAHMEKRVECALNKRAFMIIKGLPELEVPGKNLEEQRKWLEANITPQVLDAIKNAVESLTSVPIEQAAFI